MYPNQIRNDANIERNVIDLQMINNFSDKNHITGETKEYLLLKLLESSKKNRIKSIAARFSVKLTDKNTKQQMIEAAVPAIEANFGVKLKQYSIDELKLAARCLTEREADPEFAQQIINSAPFCDGAVYLIAKKDKFFTAVPHELAGKLMMRFVTQCFDDSQNELDRSAAACAAIYGSFSARLFADAANNAYSLGLTEKQAAEYLQSADSSLFQYEKGTAHAVSNKEIEIQPQASAIDYYLPTRREMEAYAAFGADSNDYYYRQIVNFVYNNASVSYDNAGTFMRQIAEWCAWDGNYKALFDIIGNSGMNLIADKFNFLTSMVAELANRTRKPSLKGHRPDEVDGIKPVVIPGVQAASVKGQTVRAEQKIGRNDPCPCGSGKKYKKCCGKNK